MKSPQDLHTIIKSLSKSEKRLFKLQVSGSQKSENNYTILFDAIDAQNEYDEHKLLQKLHKHNFSKQISRTKFLLYEQILKALRHFYSTKVECAKLDSLLHSIDVLFYKALYTQAYKILKRGKKIATVNQLTSWQQKFLEKEKQLLPFLENHKTIQIASKQLLEDSEQVFQKLHTENSYRSLHTKVRAHYDTLINFHRPNKVNALFNEVMDSSLMKDEKYASSFYSKVLFMEVAFLNAHIRSDFFGAAKWGEKIFEYWQEYPLLKTVFKFDFNRQLRDLTFFKIAHKNLDITLADLLKEWNTIKENALSKVEAQKYQFEIDVVEFIHQVNMGNYSKIDNKLSNIKANLSLVKVLPFHLRILVLYHIAVCHFLKKEYTETWSIIKRIDELGGDQLDTHTLKHIRLMELIIRYELEDHVFKYKDIQNIKLQFNSLGTLGKVDEIILELIKEPIKKSEENSKIQVPINNIFIDKLYVLKQHPNSISHQIFQIWINDKIRAERKKYA